MDIWARILFSVLSGNTTILGSLHSFRLGQERPSSLTPEHNLWYAQKKLGAWPQGTAKVPGCHELGSIFQSTVKKRMFLLYFGYMGWNTFFEAILNPSISPVVLPPTVYPPNLPSVQPSIRLAPNRPTAVFVWRQLPFASEKPSSEHNLRHARNDVAAFSSALIFKVQ